MSTMAGDYVIALYRPREGMAEELEAALRAHVPLLRSEGLATDAPRVLLRSRRDGTWLELFQWTEDGAVRADDSSAVEALRERLGRAARFVRLADLAEAQRLFPTFEEVP